MKLRIAAAIMLVCLCHGVIADEGEASLLSILGLTLDQAFDLFGAPAEVFPLRGQEAWHDDVVFYYPRHIYLFWFQNRVWQIRVDRRYDGSFFGVAMGLAKEEVLQRLGSPLATVEESVIYQLADRGYPIRLRLIFEERKLADAYLYRADF